MGSNISGAEIQVPRALYHPGPFEGPLDLASAAMAICENNGVDIIALTRGVRVPFEASVVFLSDEVTATALTELCDAAPTWTLITRPANVGDLMPALISAVRNNRHAAIVVTTPERSEHWGSIAGTDLVHVAVDDPIGFFGDVIGGAE
jgi:hypothetical protein